MAPQFERVRSGSGHQYRIDGHRVKGVTSILSDGVAKPALTKWAAETAANCVIDNWDAIQKMTPSQRHKYIAAAPYRDTDRSKAKGTEIHTHAENLVTGNAIAVRADIRGYVDACASWLRDFSVKPLMHEIPLCSVMYQYGGTADLIAEIDGETALIDYKSNRSGLFGDMALQLSGYAYAEWCITSEGIVPMPHIDKCYGVRLMSDGNYEFCPVEVNGHTFSQFLAAQTMAEFAEESRYYIGAPLSPVTKVAA